MAVGDLRRMLADVVKFDVGHFGGVGSSRGLIGVVGGESGRAGGMVRLLNYANVHPQQLVIDIQTERMNDVR